MNGRPFAAWVYLLLVSMGLACADPLRCQTKDAKDSFADLIAQAIRKSNLRSSGAAPFVLRADITVQARVGASSAGSYRLIWLSEERWREEIELPGFWRVRVGGAGKFWQTRNLDYSPHVVGELEDTLNYVAYLRLASKGEVRKPNSRKKDGRMVSCSEIRIRRTYQLEFCLDPSTGTLVRIQWPGDTGTYFEYGDYHEFQGRLYPGQIRNKVDSRDRIVVRVVELAEYHEKKDALFIPQVNAASWVHCEEPEGGSLDERRSPSFQSLMSRYRGTFIAEAFGVVGTDGKLKAISVTRSAGVQFDADYLAYLNRLQLHPRTCNGVPFEFETSFSAGRAIID